MNLIEAWNTSSNVERRIFLEALCRKYGDLLTRLLKKLKGEKNDG